MEEKDYGEALAVIFDPIRGNMLTTRSVLNGMGFRRIDSVSNIDALERRLKDVDVSILFIDASEDTKKIVELLQSIRLGETRANPFLPFVVTLWNGSSETVASLMNSGCDDVLLRPFSITKSQERVKFLIQSRKKFVVTSDYVGPDRGKPGQNRMSVESFEVPNPLKEIVVGGESDPLKQFEIMEAAKRRINKERLAKLARRIAMAAEVTIQSDGVRSVKKGFVVDLMETSNELIKTAKRMGHDDIQDIVMVLESVVEKTAAGINQAENAQLTRQLASAIYVAYAEDDDDKFKAELENTLDVVRARLQRAKLRAKKRMEIVQSVEEEKIVSQADIFGLGRIA